MELYDLIEKRASCRNFLPDPIPEDVLSRILSASCKSPSGGGFQATSIIVIDDPEKRKKLVKMSRGQSFLATAPVSLVFCVDYNRMSRIVQKEPAPFHETEELKNFWMSLLDVGIMAQTAVFAAEAEGLKSCYNGNVIDVVDKLTEMLELPEKVFPAIMLTLGYPKGRTNPSKKYPMEVLVHRNKYELLPDDENYQEYLKHNNYKKYTFSPKKLEQCCEMAEKWGGKELSNKVRKDIEEKGYLSPYQFWFGCWYQDDPSFMKDRDYWDYFARQGFNWLTGGTND